MCWGGRIVCEPVGSPCVDSTTRNASAASTITTQTQTQRVKQFQDDPLYILRPGLDECFWHPIPIPPLNYCAGLLFTVLILL